MTPRIVPVDSCAFLPCDQVAECSLVGGCTLQRFPGQQPHARQQELKTGARKLAGGKPRPTRDPTKIKRRRKAL